MPPASAQLLAILDSYPNFRPTAGNCLVRIERKPLSPSPSIVIPETARDLKFGRDGVDDIAYYATVLRMTPRKDVEEEFRVGDRVWLMLLEMDLQEEYIMTKNTRVYAREKREGEE